MTTENFQEVVRGPLEEDLTGRAPDNQKQVTEDLKKVCRNLQLNV